MCKLPVGEPHLWPALQTEWVEKALNYRSNCCAVLTVGGAGRSVIGRAAVVLSFLAFKKYLGRIEMRTRNKKYLGRIRSV